jgi:hypothetical protein
MRSDFRGLTPPRRRSSLTSGRGARIRRTALTCRKTSAAWLPSAGVSLSTRSVTRTPSIRPRAACPGNPPLRLRLWPRPDECGVGSVEFLQRARQPIGIISRGWQSTHKRRTALPLFPRGGKRRGEVGDSRAVAETRLNLASAPRSTPPSPLEGRRGSYVPLGRRLIKGPGWTRAGAAAIFWPPERIAIPGNSASVPASFGKDPTGDPQVCVSRFWRSV